MILFATGLTVAVMLGAGRLFLYVAKVRIHNAWSIAPAVTAGLVAIELLIISVLHVPWNRYSALIGFLLIGGLTLYFGRRRQNLPPESDRYSLLYSGLILLVVTYIVHTVIRNNDFLTLPIQGWDPVFHMSGTTYVRENQTAAPIGGLSPLYGGVAVFYPSFWHALTAIMPGSVVAASNALTLIVVILWSIFTPALINAMFAHRLSRSQIRLATCTSILLSASIVSLMFLTYGMPTWPYALSLALLPGALAPAISALHSGIGWQKRFDRLIVALIALCAVAMAHPAGAILWGILLLPWILTPQTFQKLHQLARRMTRSRKKYVRLLLPAGILALMAVMPIIVQRILRMAGYEREPANALVSAKLAIFDNADSNVVTVHSFANLIIVLFALVAFIYYRRKLTPFMFSLVLVVLLTMIAGGPDWFGRAITGPWYMSRPRLVPASALFMVYAAGLGVVAMSEMAVNLLQRWPNTRLTSHGKVVFTYGLSACLVLGSFVGTGQWRIAEKERSVSVSYTPETNKWNPFLSRKEAAFIAKIAPKLKDGYILGDPYDGTPYFKILGGAQVNYAQMGWIPNIPWTFVAKYTSDVGENPLVCSYVKEMKSVYYYRDDSMDGAWQYFQKTGVGGYEELHKFPEKYLRLLYSEGPYKLYRIQLPC